MTVKLTQASMSDMKIIRENLDIFNESGTRFLDEIMQKMEALKTSPYLGTTLETKTEMATDYRFLVFRFTKRQIYIIIYKIDEKEEIVYINRVFDGRMNYLSILFG